jgi:hypothetical protein
VYTTLAFLAALAFVGAIAFNFSGTQPAVTQPSAVKHDPFPPNVLQTIQTVYGRGTDFAQACAAHKGLGEIHSKLLAFRSSTVWAISVLDKAKFPPAYEQTESELRRGLSEVRHGEDRTLEYWSKGDLKAIPDGGRRVQRGLSIINAEINGMNNRM